MVTQINVVDVESLRGGSRGQVAGDAVHASAGQVLIDRVAEHEVHRRQGGRVQVVFHEGDKARVGAHPVAVQGQVLPERRPQEAVATVIGAGIFIYQDDVGCSPAKEVHSHSKVTAVAEDQHPFPVQGSPLRLQDLRVTLDRCLRLLSLQAGPDDPAATQQKMDNGVGQEVAYQAQYQIIQWHQRLSFRLHYNPYDFPDPEPFMDTASERLSSPDFLAYRQTRQAHWDRIARKRAHWRGWGGTYHRRLMQVYRSLIPAGQRVLEIGCGEGDLLAALAPSPGVGVDFSGEMLRRARARHPGLHFVQADAHDLSTLNETFDYILFSDTVNDLWDVQTAFEQVRPLCTPRTRVVLNYYSRLWELPLALAQRLGLATPLLEQNWLTTHDLSGMLHLAGFEVIRSWHEVLWPLPVPLIEPFFNRFVARFWPFDQLTLANFLIARPQPEKRAEDPSVSVIVPARNEAGNIPSIFERLPRMGRFTELIFIEGHSHDDTYAVIEREIAAHPETRSLLLRQTGIGKADAVRLGFEKAQGDILMILDADLTVPPEDLPRFYEALRSGKGEFINGVRLVYPMERQAMRGLNFLGNKFFSWAFSWLLGQPIKDTLCGTKALWRSDYERIAANRACFGDFDPFGDFDLLFGAARLGLKIVDLPIRYHERTYGTTNIHRWRHGWLLFKMLLLAARRIKFI